MTALTTDPVRFLLNDEVVSANDVAPTTTLLQYLREQCGLTGTKEGCAEGDCGACTVVLAELDGEHLKTYSVNACIQFVPTLDGKAVYTVEHLKSSSGSLHPVQQAMVECNASQCGFCTPGFVMSLWSHYLDTRLHGAETSRSALLTSLSGNLCRCTGYRPIIDAGQRMLELPPVAFDSATLMTKLRSLQRAKPFHYCAAGVNFYAPSSLQQLLELRAELPDATLLAGCTDIGLWVNKQFRDLGDIIYIGKVQELRVLQARTGHLSVGAAVNLTDAYTALAEYYPELQELWERFASPPIRNVGTLGGNLANGSPIGDSMPWLIALQAQVELGSVKGKRTLALEDLYLDYMQQDRQPDELLTSVDIPLPKPNQQFRTYKVSKRYDSDISAVCAAFCVELDGDLVTGCRVAFGGMAATPRRASCCEDALVGKPWCERSVHDAMLALEQDYQPLSDMRASADYRRQTASNLLYRFYLETSGDTALAPQQLSVFSASKVSP